ncbi:MAG: noncanonical pyrimidine nucleotidase, YjjG family [Bacteroidetes bacterium 4484_276]|nr:MAG: noncanonical pyrimidine nucleotidase, YjjG family [Bacteroidetes bacterium 4484_276]OYT13739.1 MAG: noncanonical pyrimidine nucleotidase, YjjG family [Bacteroidetes bacterium 4572_114]
MLYFRSRITETMKKYKHIFFDLDRTLWDFEKNAQETYKDIYKKYSLRELGIKSIGDFTRSYLHHNNILWALYRDGKIEKNYLKSRRFELTLLDFGIDDPTLAEKIGLDYITISPQKTNLFPHTHDILIYLNKKYPLHIITNGFEEVQDSKLKNSKLDQYFEQVITSEDAGCKKPTRCIFDFALRTVGTNAAESVMIGDDFEVDIVGASEIGMDAVFFNPQKVAHNGGATFEIQDLIELKNIL